MSNPVGRRKKVTAQVHLVRESALMKKGKQMQVPFRLLIVAVARAARPLQLKSAQPKARPVEATVAEIGSQRHLASVQKPTISAMTVFIIRTNRSEVPQ